MFNSARAARNCVAVIIGTLLQRFDRSSTRSTICIIRDQELSCMSYISILNKKPSVDTGKQLPRAVQPAMSSLHTYCRYSHPAKPPSDAYLTLEKWCVSHSYGL